MLSDTSTWPGTAALLPVLATAALMVVGAGSPARAPGNRLASAASVAGCALVGGAALRVADTGLGLRAGTVFVEDRTMVVSGCADAPTDEPTLARCATDVEEGGPTLVLVGDSQAVSVHDGVVAAAGERGLGVVPIANSGCPFLAEPAMGNESCRALLDGAQDVIDARNPDVVVVANAGVRYLGADDRIPDPDGGLPRTRDGRMASYVRSLLGRVESLRRPGRLVVVVIEAPQVGIDQRISLLQRTERWEDGVLSEQDDRAALWSAVAASLAGEADVAVVDLAGWLCEGDRCPVFAGDGSRRYFDGTHLSRDGSLALADAFRDVLGLAHAAS